LLDAQLDARLLADVVGASVARWASELDEVAHAPATSSTMARFAALQREPCRENSSTRVRSPELDDMERLVVPRWQDARHDGDDQH
jgi:hypothetical protein